jgi:hypothetical protein
MKDEVISLLQLEIDETFMKAVLILEIREHKCHLLEHLC